MPDSLIIRYFELTTDILPSDLETIKKAMSDGCNPKDCKLILARTVTGLYHTKEETLAAEQFYQEAFAGKKIPQQIQELQIKTEKDSATREGMITLRDAVRVLVANGWVASGSELRRLVDQGGVQKNCEKVTDMETVLHTGDVLRIGKKKFVKIIC